MSYCAIYKFNLQFRNIHEYIYTHLFSFINLHKLIYTCKYYQNIKSHESIHVHKLFKYKLIYFFHTFYKNIKLSNSILNSLLWISTDKFLKCEEKAKNIFYPKLYTDILELVLSFCFLLSKFGYFPL